MIRLVTVLATAVLLSACGDPEKPVLSKKLIGSCEYISPFTNDPECRDYLGDWSVEDAQAGCVKLKSTLKVGEPCPDEPKLGDCLTDDKGEQLNIHILGTDATKCGSSKTGCQFFGGGYWDPAPICGGPNADEIVVNDNPFPMPELICKDPLPGEPVGQSEGGQVCTWQMISGATEEGRTFSDYASCEPVRRQRPYSPVPPNDRYNQSDSRMTDPDYVADVDWVREQTRASACVCCHDAKAPNGPSVWDIDGSGNLLNMFNDRGIAMGAGWISTVGFGAYPPEENNGFARADLTHPNDSIFPTTDMARMIRIFEDEGAHRGLKESDFADDTYGAGPLDVLRSYQPEACTSEEGIDSKGKITWAPGRARYVYVLEEGTISPTVPPNLDLPDGVIWRLDLAEGEAPQKNDTVTYGVVPDTMVQRFPASGAPAPLVKGQRYYLYVTADVVYPISRCIFTAK